MARGGPAWQPAKNRASAAEKITFGTKPGLKLVYYFTNRFTATMESVKGEKKAALLLPGLLLFYLSTAGLLLEILPQPPNSFEYVVAGAFGACLTVSFAFALYTMGGISPRLILRTARKSARLS